MDYKETIDWLFSQLPMYQRVGQAAYKSNLQTTIDLLNRLSNPQNSFKAIHIAGTNGKGSVSHILASILQEAGYKTALYTSPHLKDFRERIRINGEMIPEDSVTQFVVENNAILESIKPSFFEMTVAMAYDYFAKEKVDIAILETGMGGRLDSTNICQPVITAVTNIGLDHMQFLGDTLAKIAIEKAGIFKEKVPIVIGRKQRETSSVFIDRANSLNSEISFAEDDTSIKTIETTNSEIRMFDLWYENKLFFEKAITPLTANYQTENISTALSIILKLTTKDFNIEKESILDGLAKVFENTALKGRWQTINTFPLAICDTAHNADGIKAVTQQIRQTPYKKLHMVIGLVNDKDAAAILSLFPNNAQYYFCKPNIPRGMPEDKLSEYAFELGLVGKTYSSVREAYNSAMNNAQSEDLIFIGGSTFVVAEIV